MKMLLTLVFIGALALGIAGGRRSPPGSELPQSSTPASQDEAVPGPEQITETVVPFNWSRLESTNYADYVNNLRAVRCPEPTITDIIRADLTKLYAPKVSGITRAGDPRAQAQEMRDRIWKQYANEAEIEAFMYDQLKLQRPVRSANTMFTAEQEERITEAASRFPRVWVDVTNPESLAQVRTNEAARIQFLSQYLSAEQLLYYKLDREGYANYVFRLLGGMQPSKEEFLAVAAVVVGKDTRPVTGSLSPEVIQSLQSVLPADRLALLLDLQSPEYQGIRNFAQVRQLSEHVVSSLVSLRRNVFTQDPTSYTQQVNAVLTKPADAELYLRSFNIHPRASR